MIEYLVHILHEVAVQISYKVDEAVHLLKSLCKRTATGHTISFIYCVHSHQEF